MFVFLIALLGSVPKSLVVYLDSGDAGPDYDDEAETLTVTDGTNNEQKQKRTVY